MRYNQLNEIRAIKLKKANDKNIINLTPKDIINSKILINDSELLRMIKHFIEPDKAGDYPYINQLISLKVGKNLKKFDKVKANNGKITINDCEFKQNENEPEKWDLKTLISNEFIRFLTASGHTRCQKSMFISSELADKIDDIIRCGIPKDQEFDKISKWNAYYGLCSTDSKAVTTPNIVVIKDFRHEIEDTFDVVHQYDEKGIKKYYVEPNVKMEKEIMPFDGAGLVSVELATQWVEDINKTIPEDKPKLNYIPAAFQFRALPGIKGNLYTFDMAAFSELYGDTIIDIKGNPHSISGEKINCIITESQFKFIQLYDYDASRWREEFDKPCHEYQRTFNISEYSDKAEELKDYMLTAYQPLQTIDFTDEEIERFCKPTIDKIKNISSNVDEFLQYRGLVDDDENSVDWSLVPPYYKALSVNKKLFADEYIYGKIKDDIKSIINKAFAAKLYTRGNYQVLTPDIYGLAQWAFTNDKTRVTGLLARNQIYSNYWNNQTYGKDKKIDKVAIVRNPHIAHEWRIGHITKAIGMDVWYKYQNTGIITSMYDTILLALNSADTDGDHIATIFDSSILAAIKRMRNEGKANTIDFVVDESPESDSKKEIEKSPTKTDDIKSLMEVDKLGMSNDIGKVVDRVSVLWSLEQTDIIQNYIKIMSIIASLTIDYAKTGDKADIPKEINLALKGYLKPYFMRYLPSQKTNKTKEECAIEEAKKYNKSDEVIKKQERFSRTNSNVNRICWHLEEQLQNIELKESTEEFQFVSLMKENVDIYGELYKKVKKMLSELHDSFSDYGQEFNIKSSKNKEEINDSMAHYRSFYQYCRYELLSLCLLENKKVDKVLDILINLYYTASDFITEDKSILWNAFGKELIIRCSGGDISNDIENELILLRKEKAEQRVKKTKKKILTKKEVQLKDFGDEEKSFIITDADLKIIRKVIPKTNTDARKLFLVFLILSRKLEEKKSKVVALRNENGKLVKDNNKKNIKIEQSYYKVNPIQIDVKAKKTINYSNLAKLACVDRRKIPNNVNLLVEKGLLNVFDCNMHNPKLLVNFEHYDGEALYSGIEVLKAVDLIKKFR